MSPLDASLIVCTYNRAHLVGGVLEALLAQELPEDLRWEIVVVDNNSKDRTQEVLEGYVREHPGRLRMLFEGRQGKSHALNLAIESADSELLLFTDDDVRLGPRWAEEIVEFLRGRPEVIGIGGRVRPLLTGPEPPRLSQDEIERYFSFDHGEEPVRITRNPFGANMAYRREAFQRHGHFRADLGPTDLNRDGLGEDSEFGERMMRAGEQLWYLPTASVEHPVHDWQLTPEHLDDWHFEYGRALVRRNGLPASTHWVGSVPRFLLRSRFEAWLAWAFSLDPARRRHRHWQLQKVRGEVYEARRIRRSGDATGVGNDEGPGHRT